MNLKYNVTGSERKSLVTAISQILNITPKYLGMPSAAYEIGSYIVTQTGELIGGDNRDLAAVLHQQGFTAVSEKYDDAAAGVSVTDDHVGQYDENGDYIRGTGEAVYCAESGMSEDDVPTCVKIELPAENVREDILISLIESKATLIRAALGDDGVGELPVVFHDGKVAFNWLRWGADGETIRAWGAFLASAVRFSGKAKRITARDTAAANEKFAMRALMVKLGLTDTEHKQTRKRLMQNLSGDSAFATAESREKWLIKHGRKSDNTDT